ncbi:UvrB/UvrC motif-containing protein [Cupriavidus alkaliphilus]|uniref:UvrB/UvrC motif-containing protein n=1 Tax=Cupriavidus alkaliphilus TaxID=942866 RepID=UPI000DE79572|nr:UvrB/UvrC motif-containing protein [Cupriavidus alkaliphilus]PVY81088.1 UvrB/UvrC motif-containing protein [Cupriavidus alkaliphilus]
MTMTKGRIERAATIRFGDASLAVCEDGPGRRLDWEAAKAWERQFKRDVFHRIVQTLNRLGWTVGPNTHIFTDNNNRYCRKGDLRADLKMSGRSITFDMFQNVNAPTRPDHGGRYEHNQERLMPYVMRLEMERTRRRIRDYLRNVFTGYTFDAECRSIYRKALELTAMEQIQRHYAESSHFKGDLTKYRISDYNNRGIDGVIEHGAQVWTIDRKGRIVAGTAYYNINNMWWVRLGEYDYTNVASFEIYTKCPENVRLKRNAGLRRKSLERQLNTAIEKMNFERAAKLRDVLFPGSPQLYAVWHDDHQRYHCAGFCGYTSDKSKAGRFTADEVRGWNSAPNRVIALAAMQEAA